MGRLPHQAPPTNLLQSQKTHLCQCSSPTILNCCLIQAPLHFLTNKLTSTPVFLSFCTKLRVSLQGCNVYLLLRYSVHTHEACCSDLAYLITLSLFPPLLRRKWTYIALVHSLSHQAMTRASDQLHTTSVCSPPVLGNTHNTCNTCNMQLHLILVHM